MKKIVYILLFILGLQYIEAQDIINDTIVIKQSDIEGRWTEAKRILNDSTVIVQDFPDNYIFKDNMVFHRGQGSEGVILFNVAGRYRIESDSIIVTYFDFIQSTIDERKAQTVVFKVTALSKNEINADVDDSQEGKYSIKLRRQIFNQ